MTELVFHESLWHESSLVWLAVLPAIALTLWFRPHGATRWAFRLAAIFVLLLAYISPIGPLANGYLFSAHMVQHLLLLLVIPLFWMLSLSPESITAAMQRPTIAWLAQKFGHPMIGWCGGLGAMWFWHIPALCNAATLYDGIGLMRDASFLLTGLAFWWPIFSPVKSCRLDPLLGVVYLFSACTGCTLLGIYITFASISVCPAFDNPADRLAILTSIRNSGFTSSVDQQLGGLLMWVPPCSLYICVIISVLTRWYTSGEVARPVPSTVDIPETTA